MTTMANKMTILLSIQVSPFMTIMMKNVYSNMPNQANPSTHADKVVTHKWFAIVTGAAIALEISCIWWECLWEFFSYDPFAFFYLICSCSAQWLCANKYLRNSLLASLAYFQWKQQQKTQEICELCGLIFTFRSEETSWRIIFIVVVFYFKIIASNR